MYFGGGEAVLGKKTVFQASICWEPRWQRLCTWSSRQVTKPLWSRSIVWAHIPLLRGFLKLIWERQYHCLSRNSSSCLDGSCYFFKGSQAQLISNLRIIHDILPCLNSEPKGKWNPPGFPGLTSLPCTSFSAALLPRPGGLTSIRITSLPTVCFRASSQSSLQAQRSGENGLGGTLVLAESHACVDKMEFASTHWIILGANFGRGCPSLPWSKAEWGLHALLKAEPDIPVQKIPEAWLLPSMQ